MAAEVIFIHGMQRRARARSKEVFKQVKRVGYNEAVEDALLALKRAQTRVSGKEAVSILQSLERAITSKAKVVTG